MSEEQEGQGIFSRRTEYCSDYTSMRVVVTEGLQPFLREEADIAAASLNKGTSAGIDNIPPELVHAGGRP